MTMRNAFETLATESKQDDLNTLVEALNTASASILAAVQAINGKVTACNTGAVTVSNMVGQGLTDIQLRSSAVPVSLTSVPAHSVSVSNSPTVALDATSLAALESISAAVSGTVGVSGSVEIANESGNAIPVSLASVPAHSVSISNSPTVALDTASLAALESVTINNQLDQPLTLAQLQGQDVKVSLDGESVSISNQLSQPITDSQLRASDVKVSLDGEQVSISNFPSTQAVSGPITNAELRASAVPVSLDSSGISSTDLQLEILNMLRLIKTTLNRLPFYDPTLNRGRMTAILESGTVTTVSTVTTCGTVTNMTNVGSYTWDTMVKMQNRSSWANNCGSKIS